MNPWDKPLITQAAKALLDLCHKEESKQNMLIPSSPKYILLQVQLNKAIEQAVLKPIRIKIPHPVFSSEHGSACLFVRSSDEQTISDYLSQHPIPGLSQIIPLDKLIKLYKTLNDRKKLLAQHTQFLCDNRIVSHLYNALGTTFGKRNRFPVPVDISSSDKISKNIQKALDSTYIHLAGTNIAIRIGISSMSCDDIVENVIEGLNFFMERLGNGKFGKGLGKVHSVHIKTGTSAALPIYSKVPSEILQYVKTLANGDISVAEEKTPKKSKNTKKLIESSDETKEAKVLTKKKKVTKGIEDSDEGMTRKPKAMLRESEEVNAVSEEGIKKRKAVSVNDGAKTTLKKKKTLRS